MGTPKYTIKSKEACLTNGGYQVNLGVSCIVPYIQPAISDRGFICAQLNRSHTLDTWCFLKFYIELI